MSEDEQVAELLEELGQVQQSKCTPEFADVWPGLLLVHRLRAGELAHPDAALDSAAVDLEAPSSKTARAEIGTDSCVFCSVAVAPYWEPPLVLLFGPLADQRIVPKRLTTPWDSRGAAREGNNMGLTGAQLVARYSIPAPSDELYVPAHLDICFRNLDEFLAGDRPAHVDAAGVFRRLVDDKPPGDLCWLHTPESRFEGGVRIPAETLRAVFVDAEALTTSG